MTHLNKTLLILFSLSLAACNFNGKKQENDKLSTQDTCKIKGFSSYWITNYCKRKSNTSSKNNKKFQKCTEGLLKETENISECDKRAFYKNKICKHMIELEYISEGPRTCFANPKHDLEWGKSQ